MTFESFLLTLNVTAEFIENTYFQKGPKVKTKESFDIIVKKYNKMIKKQINLLHIYKGYEEFYQAGLIGLWQAYERFDSTKGSFSTFAYASVRGNMLSLLRSENRIEKRFTPMDETLESMIEVEHGFMPFEDEVIEQYCQWLTEKQALWLRKAFIEQKTSTEIAHEVGVTRHAVQGWRRQALIQLRKQLKKEMSDS